MNARKYSITDCLLALLLLNGCTMGTNVDYAYVSPDHYQSYDCKQIKAEQKRVSAKIEQASQVDATKQVLDAAVTVFAISQNYGLYNDDGSDQLRLYRNQYDVLEQTAIQKKCF